MSRPTIHAYLMNIAHAAADRSTCNRKHVGAVISREGRVLATGYNGAIGGMAHCDEVGHDLVKLADGSENCWRAIHAEQNCIAQAARHGVSVYDTVLYVNTFPCWQCARLVISAGIKKVIFDAEYRNDPRVVEACRACGVELQSITTLL